MKNLFKISMFMFLGFIGTSLAERLIPRSETFTQVYAELKAGKTVTLERLGIAIAGYNELTKNGKKPLPSGFDLDLFAKNASGSIAKNFLEWSAGSSGYDRITSTSTTLIDSAIKDFNRTMTDLSRLYPSNPEAFSSLALQASQKVATDYANTRVKALTKEINTSFSGVERANVFSRFFGAIGSAFDVFKPAKNRYKKNIKSIVDSLKNSPLLDENPNKTIGDLIRSKGGLYDVAGSTNKIIADLLKEINNSNLVDSAKSPYFDKLIKYAADNKASGFSSEVSCLSDLYRQVGGGASNPLLGAIEASAQKVVGNLEKGALEVNVNKAIDATSSITGGITLVEAEIAKKERLANTAEQVTQNEQTVIDKTQQSNSTVENTASENRGTGKTNPSGDTTQQNQDNNTTVTDPDQNNPNPGETPAERAEREREEQEQQEQEKGGEGPVEEPIEHYLAE